MKAPYEIRLWLTKRFQRYLKMVYDAGRTPEHGHTLSWPCEPYGSDELIIQPSSRKCINISLTLSEGQYVNKVVFRLVSRDWCVSSSIFGCQKGFCNLPKIQIKRPNLGVFRQKDANGIANSEDPDQTAPLGAVEEQSDLGLHCLLRPVCPKT